MDFKTDHATIWSNCLATIRKLVDGESFQTWFAPIRSLKLAGNELTIQIPNRLFYEFLEEHYIDVLSTSLHAALGGPGQLQYRIAPRVKPVPPPGMATQGRAGGDSPKAGAANPFVIPGVQRRHIESNLDEKYTFDNFVQGDCNSLARNAAKAVADNPSNTAFNPLVLHGDVGLGKTHLLQAIGNYILNQPGNKKAVTYVSTDTFTDQLVNSIGNNTTSKLVNYYQSVDVLLVDDIQQLVNRKKTQDVFFNLFNLLRQANKAVVLTCDRPIIELDIPDRLRSRFQWGLSADLGVPALETRMAILKQKASVGEVDIPADVAEFICLHIQHNIRQLEGVLNNLVLHRGVRGNDSVDMSLAKEVLRNFVTEINKSITPDVIQRTVADYYNLEVEKLSSATRRRQVVLARQISMFLVKQHTDNSLKSIGAMFGNRDHSTVLYSIKTVKDLMETNDEIRKALSELERKIRIGKGEG